MYRANLSSLDVHIGVVVLDNCQALKNGGHDINEHDMLEQLLEAYLLAQDNEFHAFIV